MALFSPMTNVSMRLGPHETAAGPPAHPPPRFSKPCQAEPSHHLCHRALLVPITKMSSRFGAHEAAATSWPMHVPPRFSKPCQADPSHHLCQIALFVPMTNASSRFALHDETAGPPVQTPPRFSKLLHATTVPPCREDQCSRCECRGLL